MEKIEAKKLLEMLTWFERATWPSDFEEFIKSKNLDRIETLAWIDDYKQLKKKKQSIIQLYQDFQGCQDPELANKNLGIIEEFFAFQCSKYKKIS